ncbi:MAG: hypothetical protein ABFS86_06895 [Planctomycetota bacterium]
MTRAATVLVLLLLVGPATGQEKKKPEVNDRLASLLTLAKADATRIRGLPFTAGVPVKKITPEEFRVQVLRDLHRLFGKGERLARMEHLLKRLKILPVDTGVIELVDRFFPKSVAANYDPFRKRISFLRGFSSHSIMVHELVHALQDQHFNIARKVTGGPAEFDRLLALGALAEGDAESVQRHYDTKGVLALTPLPAVETWGRQQIEKFLARATDIPRGVARPFIFQYFDGMLFVEALKRTGNAGYEAVNRAWDDPPESTEQVLHPRKYIVRDRPTRILPMRTPGGRKILLENTLGELGVGIVLEAHLGKGWPRAAAAGWDGDRVLLLSNGENDPVLAWLTTWDTANDAREFAAAAKEMLALRKPEGVLSEDEGSGILVRTEGETAHAVVHRHRDVLFVLGLPKGSLRSIVTDLLRSAKVELRPHRSRFGSSD